MPCKIPNLQIQPLSDNHLREAFCCGNEIIDRFFVDRALKDHNENKVRVRVATSGDDLKAIGFYSLALKTLAPKSITGKIGSKFGKWPIPAVYLSMIATDGSIQKSGVGFELMFHVFQRTLEIADIAGTACLALDAVDQDKAAWYEGLSFKRMGANDLGMYIPLGTIRSACETAGY